MMVSIVPTERAEDVDLAFWYLGLKPAVVKASVRHWRQGLVVVIVVIPKVMGRLLYIVIFSLHWVWYRVMQSFQFPFLFFNGGLYLCLVLFSKVYFWQHFWNCRCFHCAGRQVDQHTCAALRRTISVSKILARVESKDVLPTLLQYVGEARLDILVARLRFL